jgi:TolB-like protein
MKLFLCVIIAATSLLQMTGRTEAQTTQPATTSLATTSPATKPAGLTVAILDFTADVGGDTNLGKQIGETLTATLSDQPGFVLLDRASLLRTLGEHQLNLTGLIDADKAVQVGKLVGAKILVSGKAFSLDKSVFITAKIIGTETSLVDGIVVKGKQTDDMGDLIMQLSDKLSDRIRTDGPRLIASDDPVDPLPELKKKLASLKLPKIELRIDEQHIGVVRAIDPPVETELRAMLTDCGFTVIDSSEVNPSKAGVQVIIKGEGLSEFAARIGNLNSCNGRLELSLVNYRSGKILFADRITTRAVDLSEQISGKTALQKAAHALCLKVLQHFADTLPAAAGH